MFVKPTGLSWQGLVLPGSLRELPEEAEAGLVQRGHPLIGIVCPGPRLPALHLLCVVPVNDSPSTEHRLIERLLVVEELNQSHWVVLVTAEFFFKGVANHFLKVKGVAIMLFY